MNLDFIPTNERPELKTFFEAGQIEQVREILDRHGVKICSTCKPRKEINEWLTYTFEHEPNWINGENLIK